MPLTALFARALELHLRRLQQLRDASSSHCTECPENLKPNFLLTRKLSKYKSCKKNGVLPSLPLQSGAKGLVFAGLVQVAVQLAALFGLRSGPTLVGLVAACAPLGLCSGRTLLLEPRSGPRLFLPASSRQRHNRQEGLGFRVWGLGLRV